MSITSHQMLCTLAVLLASLIASCKEQSSPPQTLRSQSTVNVPSPATNNLNAAPATNANASSSDRGAIDACKLLTGEEIRSIQRDTLKDITPSLQSNGPFITSQCFYATGNFVNSVSLTVTQQSSNAGGPNIREFWKERFQRADSDEKERERKRDRDKKAKASEEEEEGMPPELIKGVGEEAYFVGNAKIGALYVIKGEKIVRISVGGSHNQLERIQKMKTLAQYVIKRL